MKILDFRVALTSKLNNLYGEEEAAAISKIYIEDRLNFSFSSFSGEQSPEISAQQQKQIDQEVMELEKGRPLQYVLGYQWFYGRKFHVNENVLIPRPETEELVELIMNECKDTALKIIDIGTGSGCIAVTLKKGIEKIEIYATDISDLALDTANKNAIEYQAKINFINDDILNSTINENEHFDIIVSNPPYIPRSEYDSIHKNVSHFEPATALFVPESDPLIYYKAILSFAIKRLTPNGFLFFEIHHLFGIKLLELIEQSGYYDVKLYKDLSGNDRFLKATKL